MTWSHPKPPEEPQQFHLHNFALFFLKHPPPPKFVNFRLYNTQIRTYFPVGRDAVEPPAFPRTILPGSVARVHGGEVALLL